MSLIQESYYKIDNKNIKFKSPDIVDAHKIHSYTLEVLSSEQEYLITLPTEFTVTVEQQMEWIQKIIEHYNSVLIVAEDENEIIGFLDFHGGQKFKLSHTGSFGMSVRKDYRGKGIGRLLIYKLFEWAIEQGKIEKISLDVLSNNATAIHLYHSVGFSEEGRQKRQVKLENGNYLDLIQMGIQRELFGGKLRDGGIHASTDAL